MFSLRIIIFQDKVTGYLRIFSIAFMNIQTLQKKSAENRFRKKRVILFAHLVAHNLFSRFSLPTFRFVSCVTENDIIVGRSVKTVLKP